MTHGSSEQAGFGRITDAQLAAMRGQVGVETEVVPWFRTVDEDAVWHFALGVGDDNPLWWSRQYASSTPAGRMFAPPTFLYAVQVEARKPADSSRGTEGWLPGALGLNGGERWIWHRPVWVGETLRVTHQLHDVREREGRFGGRSVVQQELFTFYGSDGLLAELYKTILRFERSDTATPSDQSEPSDPAGPARDDVDNDALSHHYAQETQWRRGGDDRFWEDVQVGDASPPLCKGPLTITSLVAWLIGAGSPMCFSNRMLYEWFSRYPGGKARHPTTGIDDSIVALHWEDALARQSGLMRGYDIGAQRIAWVAHAMTDWCGDTGSLVGLDARLRAPNYMGDVTTIRFEVTGKRVSEGRGYVECAVVGENQRGEVTITAQADVTLPLRSLQIDTPTTSVHSEG